MIPTVSLRNRESYRRFRAKCLERGDTKVLHRDVYMNIVEALFKEIAIGIAEKDAGVFIPRLGYFAVWMTPCKRKISLIRDNGQSKVTYNHHSDSYIYHIGLFTELAKNKAMRYYTMDREFVASLALEVSKNIFAGKKYKLHLTELKQILRNKKAL